MKVTSTVLPERIVAVADMPPDSIGIIVEASGCGALVCRRHYPHLSKGEHGVAGTFLISSEKGGMQIQGGISGTIKVRLLQPGESVTITVTA